MHKSMIALSDDQRSFSKMLIESTDPVYYFVREDYQALRDDLHWHIQGMYNMYVASIAAMEQKEPSELEIRCIDSGYQLQFSLPGQRPFYTGKWSDFNKVLNNSYNSFIVPTTARADKKINLLSKHIAQIAEREARFETRLAGVDPPNSDAGTADWHRLCYLFLGYMCEKTACI